MGEFISVKLPEAFATQHIDPKVGPEKEFTTRAGYIKWALLQLEKLKPPASPPS